MGVLPRRYAEILRTIKGLPARLAQIERNLDALLLPSYASVAAPGDPRAELRDREFRRCSQNGEDGILLWLFSRIGTSSRRFVEFGIGDGRQCNAANLALSFGWSGLFLEGSPEKVEAAREFYGARLGTRAGDVQIRNAFLTAENIDDEILKAGIPEDIDYWIWKAIRTVRPRIVVVEYNASLGPDQAISVPYDPKFRIVRGRPDSYYHGASLAAFAKLGREKGYDLVGCDSSGVNAFFVRGDLRGSALAARSPREAFYPSSRRARRGGTWEEQFERVRHKPFVTV
jgi:hypothetical protein